MVNADVEALEHAGRPWIDTVQLNWWETPRVLGKPDSDGVFARGVRSGGTDLRRRPSGIARLSDRARLQAAGFRNIGRTSAELDLRDREPVLEFLDLAKPRYGVLAAAKVGGILAKSTFPVDFLSDNLRIQLNVLDGARSIGVARLLFLGSS